ncbi:MAG: hypothetical protein LBR79_06690 [Oscillospiraceae bacterium]|nr:hypothetical protein [Oscillospiraceae bacterium]
MKENQEELLEDLEDSFSIQLGNKFDKIKLDSAIEHKFGHGRYKRKIAYVDSNPQVIEGYVSKLLKLLLSPPAEGGGKRYYQLIWATTVIEWCEKAQEFTSVKAFALS